MQMIRECPAGFQVLVGSAPTLWPSLQAGAVGAVLAFANAAPYATIAIWKRTAPGKRKQAGIGRGASPARLASSPSNTVSPA